MSKMFSPYSKSAQFLSRIWDLLVLNFLFILGSLPIITFGVSAIATYTVALKVVEDTDESIIRAYFKAYKANLSQGIILTIAYIIGIGAVALDFLLFDIVDGNPIGFLILGIVSAFFVYVHFFYVWALAARYENTVYLLLTNSRRIFIRYFLRSLSSTVLIAFIIWLFFLNQWVLLFIGVFLAPILIISIKSAFAIKLFRKIEADNLENGNDELTPEDKLPREKDDEQEDDGEEYL